MLARLFGELSEWLQCFFITHLRGGPVGPETQVVVSMQAMCANGRHQVAPAQLASGTRRAGENARVGMGKARQ
ncbi:hypothetical protein D9M71_573820 [compost metagenome]